MCDCNKRIEKLKEVFKSFIDNVHDIIVSTTQESESFYNIMSKEFDQWKAEINEV